MNFMCKKHRDKLSEDPKSATELWCRLMYLARRQAKTNERRKSVISYGNALDAAQIIFQSDPTSPEVNRYIGTASELVYIIRQCDYPCDIQGLVVTVTSNLKKSLYPANVQLLLRPLTEIAYSPLSEVDQWMQAVFKTDTHLQNYSNH
jgi:hypothetical protein